METLERNLQNQMTNEESRLEKNREEASSESHSYH